MTTKIINGKTYHSGVVLNAKGDIGSVSYNVFASSASAARQAQIAFYSNGVKQKINTGAVVGTSSWVATTPNPPAWIGATNYQMKWDAPINGGFGPGSAHFPTTSSGYVSMTTQRNFTVNINANQGEAQWTWAVTIKNIATGQEVAGSVSCYASSGFL